ncbi:MAG: DUF4115 domain-containing protein [Armatimonadota bacterium]|nr:DUF4115 domain-containing protein [Armatimonadota bacterium]
MADETASIGEILRNKRESKNLTVEDVHEATKITVEYITALEENRFDAFPNKVYARAFLRDYANFLGLDSSVLLTRYEEEYQTPSEPEQVQPKTGQSLWRIVLGVAIVLALVAAGVVGYDWFVNSSLKSASKYVRVRTHSPARREAALPAEPVGTSPRLVPPKSTTPEQPTTKPSVPDKLTLQVTPVRDVWVRIKCDGVRVYEGIMPKGSSKTFVAREFINIRAGMAGAVQLILNGVPQPPMGTLRVPGEKTFRRSQVTVQ